LVRAVVEGVCLQLATIVERIDRIEPVFSVRATGGVFRSRLWRYVMAAALGLLCGPDLPAADRVDADLFRPTQP